MASWTRRKWLQCTGGALGAAFWQVPRAPQNVRVGAKPLLTVNDLTWEGQVNAAGTSYANTTLAIRYVGGERRFLTCVFAGGAYPADLYLGDLVEYAVRSPLKNGSSDWTAGNVPGWTEVRRWHNWTTKARMIGHGYGGGSWFTTDTPGGNGVMPASFYWVPGANDTEGYLWYTYQPSYGGGIFPVYSAVKLTDAEAGGNVSDAHIYGPYYFRGTAYNDWKDGTCALIPIPANRQVALGGKFIAAGHYQAVVGAEGANTVGMWVVGDLPDLSTSPPAQDSVLWPTAKHLLNTGLSTGLTAPNMHRPPNYFGPIYMMPPCVHNYWEHNGTVSLMGSGDPVGTTVGDCLYSGYDHGWIDCLDVRMITGASGGSWQPEIWNGSAWVAPTGWAVSVGDTQLSGADNVFYWPKVQFSQSTPSAAEVAAGDGWGYRVRVRRITTGTSGGSLRTVVSTISTVNNQPYPYRADPVGGYGTTYNDTHYGYSYMEFPWGGAWVQTGNVDGLAYFMAGSSGALWYGAAPMYAVSATTGLPVRYECPQLLEGAGYANGGKLSGPVSPYFFTWSPAEFEEVIAGTRHGDNRGLNPKAFTRVDQTFTGLIGPATCVNPNSSHYGEPTYNTYAWGNAVVFDPVTKELIVLFANGVGTSGRNILAFWQVR